MKKTLYWIDKEWYDNELNRPVGDMGFTFCDAPETLTEDFEQLKSSMIEYANEEIFNAKEDYGEEYLADNADFPIYSILKAEFEYDDDDYPTLHDRDYDTQEVVFECAYCTSERAKTIEDFHCDYYAGDYYDESKFVTANQN